MLSSRNVSATARPPLRVAQIHMNAPYKSAQRRAYQAATQHDGDARFVHSQQRFLAQLCSPPTGPAAGQALYSLEQPTPALAYARGGTPRVGRPDLLAWTMAVRPRLGRPARHSRNAVLHRTDHCPRLDMEQERG